MWTQGNVFIDRDPKHFGLIMNYLRDGTHATQWFTSTCKEIERETLTLVVTGFVVLPRSEESLREIMVEAAHYKVASPALHTHAAWPCG